MSAAVIRPLLAVDGDSFAHRAYHALPKTIRRKGNKPAGAIVGFANFLLRLYEAERPRAIVVGWDTLNVPTYRNRAFPAYQSGRQFDNELVEQLKALPEFVTACGFASAKAPGYEADDFLAAAVAREEKRGGRTVVATGDRDAFQLASPRTIIVQPAGGGEMVRIGPAEVFERYGVEPKQVADFIALRGDPADRFPVRLASDRKAPPLSFASTGALKPRSKMDVIRPWPINCAFIDPSQRWTKPRRYRRGATRNRLG